MYSRNQDKGIGLQFSNHNNNNELISIIFTVVVPGYVNIILSATERI